MSDPVTNVEIEDVLSSIRRLVSDEARNPAGRTERPARERLVLTPAQRVREEAAKAEAGRAMPAQDLQPEAPRSPTLLAGYELRAPSADDQGAAPIRDDARAAPVDEPPAPMPEDSAAPAEDWTAPEGALPDETAAEAGPEQAAHEDEAGLAAQDDPAEPEIRIPAYLLRGEDEAGDAGAGETAEATGVQTEDAAPWDAADETDDVLGSAEAEDTFAPDAPDATALPARTALDSAADVFAFHAAPREAPAAQEDHRASLSDARDEGTGDMGDGPQDALEPEDGALQAGRSLAGAAQEKPPADTAEAEPAAAQGDDTADDAGAATAADPADSAPDATPETAPESAEASGDNQPDGPHVTFVHASDASEPAVQPQDDVASGDPQTLGVIGLEDKIARLEAMISRGATPWDPATEEEAEAPPPEDDIAAIPFRTRSRSEAPREEYTFQDEDFDDDTQVEIDCDSPFGSGDEALIDEEALRDMVAEIVRQELQGALGERITRNVRKLVRREINRAMLSQDFD